MPEGGIRWANGVSHRAGASFLLYRRSGVRPKGEAEYGIYLQ